MLQRRRRLPGSRHRAGVDVRARGRGSPDGRPARRGPGRHLRRYEYGLVGTQGSSGQSGGRRRATVEVLPGPPGAAAARKLLRSVFFKGLAAAITEALRAARTAGCEDWLRENIGHELAGASAATVDRLERGSARHARRRADEMAAAAELLRQLGVPPRVATASEQWLQQLAGEHAAGLPPEGARAGPAAGPG